MDQGKNNTFARMLARRQRDLKKSGKGCSSRPPITTPLIKPIMQTPPVNLEVQTIVSARPGDAARKVEAIPISFGPTQKKKKNKQKAAWEPLVSSKCNKRNLPEGPPLSGLLDPNAWVVRRIHLTFSLRRRNFSRAWPKRRPQTWPMNWPLGPVFAWPMQVTWRRLWPPQSFKLFRRSSTRLLSQTKSLPSG